MLLVYTHVAKSCANSVEAAYLCLKNGVARLAVFLCENRYRTLFKIVRVLAQPAFLHLAPTSHNTNCALSYVAGRQSDGCLSSVRNRWGGELQKEKITQLMTVLRIIRNSKNDSNKILYFIFLLIFHLGIISFNLLQCQF